MDSNDNKHAAWNSEDFVSMNADKQETNKWNEGMNFGGMEWKCCDWFYSRSGIRGSKPVPSIDETLDEKGPRSLIIKLSSP